MGLVGYSDSEGSDDEIVKPQPTKTAPATTPALTAHKPKIEKVVNRSSNKILVNLPVEQEPVTKAGDIDKERPTKRARTNNAASSINSFLPAPKNPGKTGAGAAGPGLLSRGRGAGLGQGINLRTGATPAFSRELPQATEVSYGQPEEDGSYDEFGQKSQGLSSTQADIIDPRVDEVKKTGKAMMFRPLSVGRKPAKKKAAQSSATTSAVAPAVVETKAAQTAPSSSSVGAVAAESSPEKKQSLFSSYQDEAIRTANTEAPSDYQPEFPHTAAEEGHAFEGEEDSGDVSDKHASTQTTTSSTEQSNDLGSLADTLNLTPAQRRQLFGRDGAAANARLTNFNLAHEYSANNAAMQDEANQAPGHNPVRAIAPGKHSLQQLLNAASNQRDALEESFASAKRNKAAAGSKYGW